MKHTTSGHKREPISHPISPKVTAGIGLQIIRTAKTSGDPHGFLAPPVKVTSRTKGSQGRY